MIDLPFLRESPDEPPEPFVDRAGAWAADLAWRDVPREVRRAGLAQVESSLGAAVWTCSLPVGDRVAATVRAEFGLRERPRTGSTPDTDAVDFLPGGATTLRGACYGHAALSMALGFDETVLGGHTGHAAALVPLAVAQQEGVSGERALTAVVAATEVSARLGSAAAVGPFRGRQTAYVHAAAAAVARGVVEDVDAETLADALALVLGQPPRPLEPAYLGSDAKLTTAAEPILTGLAAVEAARQGSRGNRDVVEADGGLLDEFADHPIPAFLGDLGERWHGRALTVKAYPGCAAVAAPVEAALGLNRDLDDRGSVTVRSVTVEGSVFCAQADERARRYVRGPDSSYAALTASVPYTVAVALREGVHSPRQFGAGFVGDAGLWRLADRVDVERDPDFTRATLRSEVPVGAMLRGVGPAVLSYAAKTLGPKTTLRHLPTLLRFVPRRSLPTDLSDAEMRLGARVTVELASGESFARTVEHPTGFAGQPLHAIRAVARKKLRRGLEATGRTPAAAHAAADRVRALDERETVSLGDLL
jgi:2-methylcitrate dehydratase PrpD